MFDETRQVATARTLHDELPAVAVTNAFIKRRGRTEQLHVRAEVGTELCGKTTGGADASRFRLIRTGHLEQIPERRVLGTFPFLHRFFIKMFIVTGDAVLDGWVFWLVALDDDVTLVFVATDTSTYLGKELEDPFSGLILRQGQSTIGLDHTDKPELGQIEAFGDDLGTDDDIDVAVVEGLVLAVDGLIVGIITVKPSDTCAGEQLGDFLFDPFRTDTFMDDVRTLAFRTMGWHAFLVVTQVATQLVVIGVQGERDIASRAGGAPATIFTQRYWRTASAIRSWMVS